MAVVYVIQQQLRYDQAKDARVPRFDMADANRYGEIKFLLDPDDTAFEPAPAVTIERLTEGLKHFGDHDHLLLIGNPVLIGWAVAIAAFWNDGKISLLQWHRREHKYVEVNTKDLFGSIPEE